MKLAKKLTKKLRKRLKMDEPQKKKLESDFLILLLAFVVVEAIFVMMLTMPFRYSSVRKPVAREMTKEEQLAIQEKVAKIVESANLDDCNEVRGVLIDGVDYERVCRNNIALAQSREQLSVAWCDKIDNALVAREACQMRVVSDAIFSGAPSVVCQQPELTEAARNFCFRTYWTEQAVKTESLSSCDEIGIIDDQTRCRQSVLIDQMVVHGKEISCNLFGSDMSQACETFKKSRRERMSAQFSCATVRNSIFSSICIERLSIAGKL